ncbi:MAG: O-antigen ligase family protein, partial [Tepidisphaeraceae bacterium]
FVMLAEVPFPFNLSGSDIVHTAPAEISLCLAFPIFWLRSFLKNYPRVSNPILIPVAAYFLVCISSSFVHWTGRDALVSMFQMFLYLVMAVKFFSCFVNDRRQLNAALYGLIAACTFVSSVLLITRSDYVLGVHKNATGTFLSYVFIILCEMWLSRAAGRRGKILIPLLLAFNLAGLVMSASRGAWMGACAGLCVILVSRRQFRLFFKVALVMIPAIAACWVLMPKEQRAYALDFDSASRNVGARIYTIQFYEHEFARNPVLGVGIGLRKETDATNVVMGTLAETGVIGLTAFLAIQFCFFLPVFKATRRIPPTHPDLSYLGLGAALVLCLFTHGLVDHYWSRTQLPVWAMAGAAITVINAQRYARQALLHRGGNVLSRPAPIPVQTLLQQGSPLPRA